MRVWLLFIIGHMGLFFYTKKGSIISTVDLPTTEIIEPQPQEWRRGESSMMACQPRSFLGLKKLNRGDKKFVLGE